MRQKVYQEAAISKIFGLNRAVFLFLMACLGCIAGLAFYVNSYYFGGWENVLSPPPKIVQFIGDQDRLYVKAADNTIYGCDTFHHRCEQADIPQSTPVRPSCDKVDSGPLLPPGKVVDTLAFRGCGADGYVDVYFVALDDGSVWQSSHGQSAYDFFGIIPLMGLLGAIGGLIVGWIILSIRRSYATNTAY